MATRIYLVTNKANDSQRLVRAANQAQAVRHVARDTISTAVAAQETLVEMLTAGYRVEDARADQDEPEAA